MGKMKIGGVIIAIDIETRGMSAKKHGILSIGICVGSDQEDRVIDKMRWDLKPLENQFFEQRCLDEFWSKHQDILETITTHALPARDQMIRFRCMLDFWHRHASNVYIVSDNPAFHFGLINYYLDEFDLLPLSYKKTPEGKNAYVCLHDADSYTRGALFRTTESQWLNDKEVIEQLGLQDVLNKDSHNHFPENDAEFIYRMHFHVMQLSTGGGGKKYNLRLEKRDLKK